MQDGAGDDEALARSNGPDALKHYRQLLEALPVPIYVTDAEGRIAFFNEPAAELAGRRPELGIDRWCITWRLYALDGTPVPLDKCPMAVALKEKRTVRGEEMLAERPDGSRTHFVPHPTPLFDEHGSLIGAINMLIDVTDRHHADVQSAILAAIVSSSDDAIVSKTLEGYITSWNLGAERIFGYSAEEMLGQHITRIIPPELRSEEEGILAKLRLGERIEHFDTIRIAKDGRRVDLSVTVSPIRDRFGRLIGASKVGRDISDRKKAERLQKLLISELNHRVKNTLATVQAIANQTVYHAKSPAEFAANFGGRIQALARTHSLLTESSWQGAELKTLVWDQLSGEGKEERITISGPSVTLNPQIALHLSLVMHELATNARKYGALSEPGGRLMINWIVRTEGSRILSIHWQERNGPPVNVPKLRGFGSNLIEKSLEAHQGVAAIRYEAEGVTCDITLALPQEEGSAAGSYGMVIPAARDDSAVRHRKSRIEGRRILVVDDEPLIAMDIVATLTDHGCKVVGPAASVEKALKLAETNEIDAALLDANLAGASVEPIAVALAGRGVPFAFVSGYGPDALPHAFRHFLLVRKPFQAEQLIEAICQVLSGSANVIPLSRKG